MKKLMVLLLAGCVLVLSPGFRTVAVGDQDEIPLSKLAGTYAVTGQGSIFFCFEPTPPFPPAECGSTGSTGLPFSLLLLGAVTRDAQGNSCATFTQTFADLPVDISPPFSSVVHNVGKVTSYDPTTATGDTSVTSYAGGQCHGATFDSTGATVQSTSTNHIAASDRGKRVDGVVTSLTNAVGSIGGFSISFTQLHH